MLAYAQRRLQQARQQHQQKLVNTPSRSDDPKPRQIDIELATSDVVEVHVEAAHESPSSGTERETKNQNDSKAEANKEEKDSVKLDSQNLMNVIEALHDEIDRCEEKDKKNSAHIDLESGLARPLSSPPTLQGDTSLSQLPMLQEVKLIPEEKKAEEKSYCSKLGERLHSCWNSTTKGVNRILSFYDGQSNTSKLFQTLGSAAATYFEYFTYKNFVESFLYGFFPQSALAVGLEYALISVILLYTFYRVQNYIGTNLKNGVTLWPLIERLTHLLDKIINRDKTRAKQVNDLYEQNATLTAKLETLSEVMNNVISASGMDEAKSSELRNRLKTFKPKPTKLTDDENWTSSVRTTLSEHRDDLTDTVKAAGDIALLAFTSRG